ncbi:tetratricopeptide repeat protein [Methanoregula sp.]|uniref:tetratricopeptide repeat protein n=1 Tax=Methanoregula sp. TaxID=2052170 RepID=UPI002616E5EA|nr:tetratricopeptide repeat protein [Methanoregula sp.]MDD5142217.1 tetratricopeptide repeat protein [Methanoregula sp.]
MKKCPECGANIPYRDNYCYACDRTFGDPGPENGDTPCLDLSKEEWRKPWAAAALSAAGIGLGQFYNGETAKGALFLIIVLGAPFVLPLFTPFNPVFVMAVVWAAAVADAWLSAGKINQLQKTFEKKSPLFWSEVACLVLACGMLFLVALAPNTAAHGLILSGAAVADTKYPESATPLYDSAVALAPDDIDIRMSRARFLYATGRDTEANAELSALITTMPDESAPLVMTGNILYENGEYEASLRYFEKALDLDRESAAIWVRKGDANLAIAIADMQKMRRQYRTLTAGSQKDTTEYPATEMDAFKSTQSYRDAMEAYNQAIKLDPLMSVEISAHVLAATQSLVEMYDGILDDIGMPVSPPA